MVNLNAFASLTSAGRASVYGMNACSDFTLIIILFCSIAWRANGTQTIISIENQVVEIPVLGTKAPDDSRGFCISGVARACSRDPGPYSAQEAFSR